MTANAATATIDRMGLAAAIATIAVAATAFGHSLPLFSILLKTYGASDVTIGMNTSAAAVAAIFAIPFFPRLMAKIGLRPFLIGSIAVMVVTYLLLYLAGDRIALWYPLRFAFGIAGAALFAGSETWINTLAPDHLRGKIMGIYGTALAAGFALGPLLIDLFGYRGFAPFLVSMVIFSLAAVPVALAKAPPPPAGEVVRGFFRLLPKAPVTFLAAAVFAATESAILIFLPVLAIENGWGAEVGARAVTVYGLGILALQYVIGANADRLGAGRTLLICAVASALLAIGFAVSTGSIWGLYLVLVPLGGMIAGLYTVGLVIVGERFGAEARAAANTGFVFMYGVGAIVGPLSAGVARDIGGPSALSYLLIVGLMTYAGLVVWRWKKRLP